MLTNTALKEQKSNIFLVTLAKLSQKKETVHPTEQNIFNWLQSFTSVQLFNRFDMSQDVRNFTEYELNQVHGTITNNLVSQLDSEYQTTLKDYLVDSLMDDFNNYDCFLKNEFIEAMAGI